MALSGFYHPINPRKPGPDPAGSVRRLADAGQKHDPGPKRPAEQQEEHEMSLIRRTSPFGELLSLRQAMDRLFEDSFVRPRAFAGGDVEQGLPLDIRMTENELVVTAALPGVKPENVDISVTGDTLTISGKTEEEKRDEQEGYLYQEIRRGTFSRTVTLPSDLKVDEARAEFENGMLRLSIPKAEEAKPRQIKISPTSEGSARQVESGDGRQTGSTESMRPGSSEGSSQPLSGHTR
jgi:HSP20 family protein